MRPSDVSTPGRPKNRETEYEDYKPQDEGEPPRGATEPDGSEDSEKNDEIATDPMTGETRPTDPEAAQR